MRHVLFRVKRARDLMNGVDVQENMQYVKLSVSMISCFMKKGKGIMLSVICQLKIKRAKCMPERESR
jgi:hypothetical protein